MPATLPEAASPCNPDLDTLVSELYGPRPDYRAAVATIAEKARAALPECNGRVEKAVKLVLAGDVDLHTDGSASVGSMSDATKTYTVAQSTCTCQDFPRAPAGFCAHRLALGIARRARELTRAQAPAPAPAVPIPVVEVPAIASTMLTIEGRQVEVKLCDTDDARLVARLTALLQQFPLGATPTQAPAEGWCAPHGVQMRWNPGKDGKGWWSHKAHDGWCKGK
jgi:hypothetical protein